MPDNDGLHNDKSKVWLPWVVGNHTPPHPMKLRTPSSLLSHTNSNSNNNNNGNDDSNK